MLAAAALLGGWFGLLTWLRHTPTDLPQDWLGLWAADGRNHPQISLATENWSQTIGAHGIGHPGIPRTTEANPAYRLASGEGIFLGRWTPPDTHRWSLAVWVRVDAGSNAPGGIPLAGGMTGSMNLPWCWGLKNGEPFFRLRNADGKTRSVSGTQLPTGEWVHLMAVYALPELRIHINGQPAGSMSSAHPPRMSREVWLGSPPGTDRIGPTIALDDFAVFNRSLSDAEVAAWHSAGRGAPMTFLGRREWARRLAGAGTAWVCCGSLALVLLAVWPWLYTEVFGGVQEMMSPPFQAVRRTLLGGSLATFLLTASALREGRRADELNLKLIAATFREAADSYLGHVANLLLRARDQVAANPDLSPAEFQTWLTRNHFPHDHPGLYGLGVALRVESAELEAFEQLWSRRHPRGFSVTPRLAEEERAAWQGWPEAPRLPVVMTVVNDGGILSRGDRTMLGRDLLALRVDEEDPGGEYASLRRIAQSPDLRSSGLVEISGAGFGGAARQGIRLFAPLFRQPPEGQPFNGPRDWAGVVFASIDLRLWLRSMDQDDSALTGVRLVTGSEDSGYANKEAIAADSGELAPELARPARPYLEREETLRVYSRRLWAQFWTTPRFDAQSHSRWPWVTASMGLSFTVFTAGLISIQVRARLRQEAVAGNLRIVVDELTAARNERERLSHDLHDGTIQSLYAVQLTLSRAGEQVGVSEPALGVRLGECRQNLAAVIGELRGFILRHQGEARQETDLAGVLTSLLERLRNTTDSHLHAQLSTEAARRLSGHQSVHLANLAREALSNAIRHAHADRIRVTLKEDRDHVTLEILDDGIGFDPVQPIHNGLGLESMAARARGAGGELQIESSADAGTRIKVTVPAPSSPSRNPNLS